ncbi:unnamed protein product [Mytilus edulis]|uniref:Uncharacterized protein n=1 Tax=Mytilus edulis TaxID=6550 RepID=A0A8S3SX74_MYTED|nr:unnamed protein product [Mytilus edulis]
MFSCRCDNKYGCINTTTKDTGDINTKFENKDSIIYIGCVGLLTIVVIILLTYICCIKTKKGTALEKANPKHGNGITSAEKHVLHWTSDKNMIDETLYDKIDDNFLGDIKANEENKNIADEEDDSNQSTTDVNDGYLNPYQPIISIEVDVHEYSSTKNEDDNSTTSDENQRDSGYLHPYQSLKTDISETKHEYTGLETNGYRYTRNQHSEEIMHSYRNGCNKDLS